MASSSVPRPPPKLYDLDVTIVSAKHLKNVNWRNGDLKPYVILWVDPDRRVATKPDDSGSTRPVWSERFVLPLAFDPRRSLLTLEIFHSRPSETPKPLVGTVAFELRDLLVDPEESAIRLSTLEIRRPSGRPHGKIRLKLGLVERPVHNYHTAPPSGYYYSSAPPPPMPYGGRSPSSYTSVPPPPPPSLSPPPPPPPQPFYSYSDPHSGYYSSYYSPQPPPRPFFDREKHSGYGGPGPSAPVDCTPYDYHKRSAGKPVVGMETGLAVGALAGGLGGLALGESIKHEEEKIAESDLASTSRNDRYGNYRSDY